MTKEKFLELVEDPDFKKTLEDCEIENIVMQSRLCEQLRLIVSDADKKQYAKAYDKVCYLLALILNRYMELDNNEFWFIDSVEYFVRRSEKNIASALVSINGEFNMVDNPKKNDMEYLLMKVCYLYNDLLECCGEREFSDADSPRMYY